MEFQSIILICVLALCVLTLLIYLLILRSSIREVAEELEEKLQTGNDELTTAVTNISHDLRNGCHAQPDGGVVPLFRYHRHNG